MKYSKFRYTAQKEEEHKEKKKETKCHAWLTDSVRDHSFIPQLDILIANHEHLHSHYYGEYLLLIATFIFFEIFYSSKKLGL